MPNKKHRAPKNSTAISVSRTSHIPKNTESRSRIAVIAAHVRLENWSFWLFFFESKKLFIVVAVRSNRNIPKKKTRLRGRFMSMPEEKRYERVIRNGNTLVIFVLIST